MEKRLKNIFIDIFKVDVKNIKDSFAMENENLWDSLKHMELIVTIEEEFKIEFSFDEIVIMKNFGKIKTILIEKLTIEKH